MALVAEVLTPFASRRGRGIRRRLISLAVMALANLLPVLGFVFFNWNLYELMTLYWAENVIIGAFTVLKMLNVDNNSVADDREILTAVPSFFAYFLFCFFHALMIQFMFQKFLPPLTPEETWLEGWHRMNDFFHFTFVQLKWVVLAMALSHGFSYVYDYNLGGEKYRTTLRKLWFLPGGRLVVMMAIIMVAAWQLEAMSSLTVFTVIITVKIMLEWLFDGVRRAATAEPFEKTPSLKKSDLSF
ncbi:MAG: hypothetical protein FJ263_02410 [Planctomycetes bacterium]|nr:hypothetical protein [Planctomycetota bacterium]